MSLIFLNRDNARIHTRAHTRTHTRIHEYTHAHTHAHAHVGTRSVLRNDYETPPRYCSAHVYCPAIIAQSGVAGTIVSYRPRGAYQSYVM